MPMDGLEIYADAMDASDYAPRVAETIRMLVPDVGDLLDVGAGAGQLGGALRAADRAWTAIEPSAGMINRLRRLPAPPIVVPAGWQDAAVGDRTHDTVLAATMPAPFQHAGVFWQRCTEWSRRSVVWVVAAHHGPRGLVLTGCLPRAWHGEDETPGIDIVTTSLAASGAPAPKHLSFVEWTFVSIVSDLERLASFLADRLGWGADDARRDDMRAHLAQQASSCAHGYRLEIPRRSAVMLWEAA